MCNTHVLHMFSQPFYVDGRGCDGVDVQCNEHFTLQGHPVTSRVQILSDYCSVKLTRFKHYLNLK